MREKFKEFRKGTVINLVLKYEAKDGSVEERNWSENRDYLLQKIIDIGNDYADQGYSLTLRQLYYQMVKENYIPNHDTVYKKLSSLKDYCVYTGLLDWDIFVDRGRIPKIAYFEEDVPGSLQRTIDNYALDRQMDQPVHVEVWTEKDAISEILKMVTDEYTIHLVVNKGYSSSTSMYGAYTRFIKAIAEGRKIKILYFGDHDPSGLDMVRDIQDRIIYFFKNGLRKIDVPFLSDWLRANSGWIAENYDLSQESDYMIKVTGKKIKEPDLYRIFFENHFEIEHIGLTMDQIKLYDPPPNPAKITDPRAKPYIAEHGPVSWEVDALPPAIMTDIVRTAIEKEIDMDQYNNMLEQEAQDIAELEELLEPLK